MGLFEKRALIITGISFYILTGGLVIGAVYNIYSGSKPETTIAGIIISIVSISRRNKILALPLKMSYFIFELSQRKTG